MKQNKALALPNLQYAPVSLNQWIAVAVAEKVGIIETAAEFFKKRAGKAFGAGLMKFLRQAPDVPPESKINNRP